jgi:hypothetical protein
MKTQTHKASKSSSVSSDPLIEKACAALDGLSQELAGRMVALSPSDRQHLPRIRKGWEGLVPKLADLAERYGVTIPGVSIDAMVSAAQNAQGLAPLAGRVAKLNQSLADTTLLAQGTTWKGATALYTVLSRAVLIHPELGAEMAPMRAFFALGSRGESVGGKSDAADAKSSAATGAPASTATTEPANTTTR